MSSFAKMLSLREFESRVKALEDFSSKPDTHSHTQSHLPERFVPRGSSLLLGEPLGASRCVIVDPSQDAISTDSIL